MSESAICPNCKTGRLVYAKFGSLEKLECPCGYIKRLDTGEEIIAKARQPVISEEAAEHTMGKDMKAGQLGYHIITLSETEEMLYYSQGVYRAGAETLAKWELEKFASRVDNNFCNETIGHIKRRTYKSIEDFESDPELLVLENGVLNTRTLMTSEQTPDILSRVKLPVKYIAGARCDKFLSFMKDVLFPEDMPVIQEWFGYCLTKSQQIRESRLVRKAR